MFAKIEETKISTWLWISLSCLLWALFAAFTALYLLRERSLNSINQLREAQSSTPKLQTSNALSDIKTWLYISSVLYGDGLAKDQILLSNLSFLLNQLINNGVSSENDLNFSCQECTEKMQLDLSLLKKLISQAQNISVNLQHSQALKENLNQERHKKIGLHFLLSKDFEELMGSASLYQSRGQESLLFYKEGPFKWLPELNDSARPIDGQSSIAIEGFSKKLEGLQRQSKAIVDEYLEIDSKLEQNSANLENLHKDKEEIELKIKDLLLGLFKSEINGL